MIGKMLVLVAGAVFLAACSSPTTQGQPKGEATSSEQAAPSADQSAVATTEHDNYVTFEGDRSCIQSASFAPQDSNITGGQPWGGVSTSNPYVANGTLELNAQAGRHDSSGPAAWFNQQAPSSIPGSQGGINNLNFAFTGELTLNGDTYLIALGQGNAGGGSSPWWLGGKGFTVQGSNFLTTPDGKYQFFSKDSDDSFVIGSTNCNNSAPSADQSAVATTEHDNFVQFNGDACITSASFAPQDSNITGGQPWGGVSTSNPYVANGTLELDVQAGRKDSSGPAAWFNQQAPVYISAGTPPVNNLNFAVTGELTLNGDTYLIALGQGNAGGGSSPWWLGGKGGFFQEPGQLITPDGKYAFAVNALDDAFWMTCNVESSVEGNS